MHAKNTTESGNAGRNILNGLHVIDSDTHLSEPHDLWTRNASSALRDRVPQVKQIDGVNHWIVDGDVDMGPATPVSVVRRDGKKSDGLEFFGWKLEDVHEASYDMKARVRLMDELGIHAQIIYPNAAGFGNQNFLKVKDEKLRLACAQIYNDSVAELQEQSDNRLFPMALVPWWHIDSCAKEIERAHALGLRGVVMCSDPDSGGLPDLGDPAWDPFWDVCGELEMPVNFHIGASQTSFNMFGTASWNSMDMSERLALGSATLFFDNARVLGNLLYSGILERFPKVKVVSVESGIGWIPFLLETLDYEAQETGSYKNGKLKMLPSEYFRRQVYGCFWFETNAPQKLIQDVGVNNVLFETDFPHPTCLYPNNRNHLQKAMGHLDENICRRVLQDNAAELYRIPLPG